MRKLNFLCLVIAFSCSGDEFTLDEDIRLNVDLLNIENSLQAGLKVCNNKTMLWLSEMLQKANEDLFCKEYLGQYAGCISVDQAG